MRTFFGILLLALLGAVGLFAGQNTQTVNVRFAGWTLTAPLAGLAVLIYLLGMVSGGSVVGFLRRSFRRVIAE